MPNIDTFLTTWRASGAAESANAQSFTNDLCDLLGVPRPDPTQPLEEYARGTQATLELDDGGAVAAPVAVAARKWPAALPEQVAAVREVLAAAEGPVALPALGQAFKPKLSKKRQEAAEGILVVLESLGSVERTNAGWVINN